MLINLNAFILTLCFVSVISDDSDKEVHLCSTDSTLHCKCYYYTSPSTNLPSVNIDCSFKFMAQYYSNIVIPTSAVSLDMSKNTIPKITNKKPLTGDSLTTLLLNNNKIEEIEDGAFKNLQNLTILDLSENLLIKIASTTLTGLNKLSSLNLAYNRITRLEKRAFETVPILKKLNLNGNQLSDFVENQDISVLLNLGINKNLTTLTLNDNNITSFPKYFFEFVSNVKNIGISKNPIRNISDLPSTIEQLDLSSTEIDKIKMDLFAKYPLITHLIMNNMRNLIEIEDDTFVNTRNLQVLKLEHCVELGGLNAEAFGITENQQNISNDHLKEISFYGSGLYKLDEKLLPLLSGLSRLDLRNNPWHCDCELSWILQLNVSEADKEDIRCYSPRRLNQRTVWSLRRGEMICDANFDVLNWVITNSLILICVIIIAMVMWLVLILSRTRKNRISPENPPYTIITLEPNNAENIN